MIGEAMSRRPVSDTREVSRGDSQTAIRNEVPLSRGADRPSPLARYSIASAGELTGLLYPTVVENAAPVDREGGTHAVHILVGELRDLAE